MVVVFRVLARSITHTCLKKSKPNQQSLSLITSFTSIPHPWRFQSLRTLILESTTSESVKLNRLSDPDSGIVEVKLERPGAKNAIGRDMLRGLQQTFDAIEKDHSANVVMICSSVPKVFCAGADLKERRTMDPSEAHFFVKSLRLTFSFLEALHVPSIAVIEGAALGGGLEMALSCDLRICGEDAVLGLPETGLAIIPGAGGTQRLPRLVGKALAKELIFTGRKICGRDAMSMGVYDRVLLCVCPIFSYRSVCYAAGLVNYCVPAGEAHIKALEIARDINQKGPIAIRMAKRAINEGLDIDMASALTLEEECYEQLLNTKDRLEGLAAFAERRKPRYNGE